MANPTVQAKKAGDILLRAGVLRPEQYESAVLHMSRGVDRIEDAILEMGLLSEGDLLKALAAHHKTRFVTTEKLAKADVTRATLATIPRRTADTLLVFPVMFDPATRVLSVVTPDPDNTEMLREVQLASGARELKAFLARPAAVKAAIGRSYGGDIHAFAALDRQAQMQFHALLETYERNLISDDAIASSLANEKTGRERVVSERQLAGAARKPAPAAPGEAPPEGMIVELLNVLISLLENGRQELRGHSAHIARLGRRVCERINLTPAQTQAFVIAAYLHDLGKQGQYHLTTYNCSEWEGHRIAGQKAYATPARLLEAVKLPEDALLAVSHMYERYDGQGFPDGLLAKEIPLGARILAVCDTYADLIGNPRNPYRKVLTPAEACDVLARQKEKIFDPHIVDLFKTMTLGEGLRAKILSHAVALVVDADPEESTVLELRLIEQGFEVKIARGADAALKLLSAGDIDVVVSDLDLPQTDGLALLAEARRQPWGKDVPWVIHTRKQGKAEAQKAFDLGAVDFVAKGGSTDLFVAKLKAMLDQRASAKGGRGVSGSLGEMGLPELVQVLSQGRKSGNLRIRRKNEAGEIHFADGDVVNALWGKLRGEEAFYEMLRLADGEFGMDPTFRAQGRVIHEKVDSLLLEGMRRLDEG